MRVENKNQTLYNTVIMPEWTVIYFVLLLCFCMAEGEQEYKYL